MSLCGGRLVVGESDSVGFSVGMHVVLPYYMCCISAYSFAPFVSVLVLCCCSFGLCLCVCMVRAFGLHGWAFVWMRTMTLGYPKVCPVVSPGCQCVLACGAGWCSSMCVVGMGASGYVGGARALIVLDA